MARIVTYAFHRRRQRKKKAAPLGVPAVVKVAPAKGERIRHHEEEADDRREVTPEGEARAEAFLARRMRPRDD
jgi:hypothetical protein